MRNSFRITRENVGHVVEIEAIYADRLDTWNTVVRLDGEIWDVYQSDDVLKDAGDALAKAFEDATEIMLDSEGQAAA